MALPQTLTLDGEDWTLHQLEPGLWRTMRVWEQDPLAAEGIPVRIPQLASAGGAVPQDCLYAKRFYAPGELAHATTRLAVEGVGGTAHFFLNGKAVGELSGPFVPGTWEVTGALLPGQENRLQVVVETAEAPGAPRGLSGSLTLRATGPGYFRTVSIHTNLSIDLTEAAVSVVCELGAGEELTSLAALVVTEITQSGLPVTSAEDSVRLFGSDTFVVQSLTLGRVQLWWPNGHGKQPLYEARVSLATRDGVLLDQRRITFGVRQIDEAACVPDQGFPLAITVNGKRIWLQGLESPSIGTTSSQEGHATEVRLMRLAQAAQVNLLRVPVEAGLASDRFYDLCDRLGILVWQEFPLRGTLPTDPTAIELLAEWAEKWVAMRRNHPSLLVWSGGQSHDGDGLSADPEHPALVELKTVVEDEDAKRLWLPVPPALRERKAAPEEVLVGNAEQALGAMELQRFIEGCRRRQWDCAGVIAPLSLREFGERNALLYAIKRAFSAFHVSASFPVSNWHGEVWFRADIWLHNTGRPLQLLNAVASVYDLHGRELFQENLAGEAPENGSECVGDLSWRFPDGFAQAFVLMLEVIDEEGETLARNTYLHSRVEIDPFAPYVAPPATELQVARTPDGIAVRNAGEALALGIEVSAATALASDGHFPLAPGQARAIRLTPPGGEATVSAWNAPARVVPCAMPPEP